MFKRVKIVEIKDIKNRLELELNDKDLKPLPERKKDVESLLYRLNDWFDECYNR